MPFQQNLSRNRSHQTKILTIETLTSTMTFLTEAWFWRGTQSAIFYYLSCAPCTRISDQRRKRKEAKRAKAEREMEGMFRHPLPSGTNPGWNEEIFLGPGPPPKRLNKEQAKRRKRMLLKPPETRILESLSAPSSTGTTSLDATDGQAVSQDLSRTSSEGWNRQRYQREDEMLWGLENVETTSSDGHSTLRQGANGAYRYYARNPDVNDLHPPIVSTHPTSRKETQWMLQPPPKAKIMEGKERANRSRSGSGNSAGGSTRSRGSSRRNAEESLGRRVGEKLLEEKLARRERPPPAPSASSLSRAGSGHSTASSASRATTVPGQRHDRDPHSIKASQDLPDSKMQQDGHGLQDSNVFDIPSAANASSRPPLSTIHSASNNVPQSQRPTSAPRQLRPPLITKNSNSSLYVLQKSSVSSQKIGSNENCSSATVIDIASTVLLPPPTPKEEKDVQALLQIDEWHPEENKADGWSFALPAVNLQTGQRWSMDI